MPSFMMYVLIDVLVFPSTVCRAGMQIEDYSEELEEMKNMTRQEYVTQLRRYRFLLVL